MSGDWIKMRKSLIGDPKVVRIMSALKADRFKTIGGLFAAWCLFDEQTEDGLLDGYTPEVLDELIRFPGMARAMESVGWLEIGKESLKVTGFSEHNGQPAKKRAQDTVRKRSARQADKKTTKSGPEKRREEKSITHTHTQRESLKNHHTVSQLWRDDWHRWLETWESRMGKPFDPIIAEVHLMELSSRDESKAAADLRFSLSKTAKSILDSENDFSKNSTKRPTESRVKF